MLDIVWSRLGFIIDLLSHATIEGFMTGAAIVVSLQQLKGILGLTKFTQKTDIVSVLTSAFNQVHKVSFLHSISFLTELPQVNLM